MSDIGTTLYLARREKGLTLKELALMIGLSTSYLSEIENNKANPAISVIFSICKALDTPATIIFMKSDAETGKPIEDRLTVREYKSMLIRLKKTVDEMYNIN